MFSRSLKAGISSLAFAGLLLGNSVGTASAATLVRPFSSQGTIGNVLTGNVTCFVSGAGAYIKMTSPAIYATDSSYVGREYQLVDAYSYIQTWTAAGWAYVANTYSGYSNYVHWDGTYEFPTVNSPLLARGTATNPRYYHVVYRAIWHPGVHWSAFLAGEGEVETADPNRFLGWGDYNTQPADYGKGQAYCQF